MCEIIIDEVLQRNSQEAVDYEPKFALDFDSSPKFYNEYAKRD